VHSGGLRRLVEITRYCSTSSASRHQAIAAACYGGASPFSGAVEAGGTGIGAEKSRTCDWDFQRITLGGEMASRFGALALPAPSAIGFPRALPLSAAGAPDLGSRGNQGVRPGVEGQTDGEVPEKLPGRDALQPLVAEIGGCVLLGSAAASALPSGPQETS